MAADSTKREGATLARLKSSQVARPDVRRRGCEGCSHHAVNKPRAMSDHFRHLPHATRCVWCDQRTMDDQVGGIVMRSVQPVTSCILPSGPFRPRQQEPHALQQSRQELKMKDSRIMPIISNICLLHNTAETDSRRGSYLVDASSRCVTKDRRHAGQTQTLLSKASASLGEQDPSIK